MTASLGSALLDITGGPPAARFLRPIEPNSVLDVAEFGKILDLYIPPFEGESDAWRNLGNNSHNLPYMPGHRLVDNARVTDRI